MVEHLAVINITQLLAVRRVENWVNCPDLLKIEDPDDFYFIWCRDWKPK